MPTIFDQAINKLTNRDELQALEAAKKVAQDALLKADSEAAMRKAAEERATKAEADLASALSAQDTGHQAMVTQLTTDLTLTRNQLTRAQGDLARVTAEMNDLTERYTAEINALKNALADAQQRTYVVKPGDTLSGIAKNVYGDWKHWQDIFEANRDKISNPDLIQVGWELKLPKIG
jgi:nucleoid-associated protein YgaU